MRGDQAEYDRYLELIEEVVEHCQAQQGKPEGMSFCLTMTGMIERWFHERDHPQEARKGATMETNWVEAARAAINADYEADTVVARKRRDDRMAALSMAAGQAVPAEPRQAAPALASAASTYYPDVTGTIRELYPVLSGRFDADEVVERARLKLSRVLSRDATLTVLKRLAMQGEIEIVEQGAGKRTAKYWKPAADAAATQEVKG